MIKGKLLILELAFLSVLLMAALPASANACWWDGYRWVCPENQYVAPPIVLPWGNPHKDFREHHEEYRHEEHRGHEHEHEGRR